MSGRLDDIVTLLSQNDAGRCICGADATERVYRSMGNPFAQTIRVCSKCAEKALQTGEYRKVKK